MTGTSASGILGCVEKNRLSILLAACQIILIVLYSLTATTEFKQEPK